MSPARNRSQSPQIFPGHRGLAIIAILACAALAPACRATDPSRRLAQLYERRETEAGETSGPATRPIESRAREVARMHEQGKIVHSEDMLIAALLLYDSRSLDNVMLSRELALRAVELGDLRGLPIAAEAEDIELMIRGLPQRYGTQYVYDPVLERWSLYPVNPKTSDSERRTMGIVSLEEARHREDVLNDRVPQLPQMERR